MTDEQPNISTTGTWRASVEEFEADADWLTGADRPQLVALYAIADALDAGTFQAALISQFTLVHRGLLARRPGPKGGGDGPDNFPGAVPIDLWRADA